MSTQSITIELGLIGWMIEWLSRKIHLIKEAKRHEFPMRKNGVYIYGCHCWMGRKAFSQWQDYMKELKVEDRYLFPLRGYGNVVATYRLLRSYRKGCRGGDLAYSDSGDYGDFRLERIDYMHNSATSLTEGGAA
jgi:hypothetical protein